MSATKNVDETELSCNALTLLTCGW